MTLTTLALLVSCLVVLGASQTCFCDAGWHAFPRTTPSMYPWCVKVITHTAGLDYAQAQQECKAYNATLSGIQNLGEFTYLSNVLKTHMGIYNSAGMWIGATINPICKTQSCLNMKTTAFTWNDGYTTGTDGFIWQSVNPSGNGDCLRLLVDPWGPQLDDVSCTGVWQALDIVCGKYGNL